MRPWQLRTSKGDVVALERTVRGTAAPIGSKS